MSVHALERLRERYDEHLTFYDMREMEAAIRAGDAKLVGMSDWSGEIWLVTYRGRRFKVVVTEKTKDMVTALPLKGKKVKAPKRAWRDGKAHWAPL